MIETRPNNAAPQPAQEIIAQIKAAVSDFYQGLDRWHNLDHGSRVVAMAMEINKSEGGDTFLVEAGAWLHQYHRPNLELLKPVLAALPLDEQQRADLFQIVAVCRPDLIDSRPDHISDAAWKAARIVFDGDALDLMGPSGVLREINCNTVARGKSHAEALRGAREVHEMFVGKLQTEAGKGIAAVMNQPLEGFWAEHDRHEGRLRKLGAASY